MYIDIETGEIITIERLYTEYNVMRTEQPEEYNYSFTDYIRNCLSKNNGTLEQYKGGSK